MLKGKIFIFCLVILTSCSFTQSLVYKHIPTSNRTYSAIAGIKSVDNMISINWELYNKKKSNALPYVYTVIRSEEEYNKLKLPNSAYVNFDKYVLFSGLFYVLSCKKAPELGLYREITSKVQFLYFVINKRIHEDETDCEEIYKPITYLIPCEYIDRSNVIYFYIIE